MEYSKIIYLLSFCPDKNWLEQFDQTFRNDFNKYLTAKGQNLTDVVEEFQNKNAEETVLECIQF